MVPEEEEKDWEHELIRGCRELGVRLRDGQIGSFDIYLRLLRQWNPQAGLVSPRDEDRLVSRHILDSLVLLRILHPLDGAKVLDVGTGGGFPGIPLKICHPGIRLTLLESREKAGFFLQNLLKALSFDDVTLHRQRAQEAQLEKDLSRAFDLVLARAVAPMDRLVALCFPFVRAGGILVAYKGQKVHEELSRAEPYIREGGGQGTQLLPVGIPGISARRYLLVLSKPLVEKKYR